MERREEDGPRQGPRVAAEIADGAARAPLPDPPQARVSLSTHWMFGADALRRYAERERMEGEEKRTDPRQGPRGRAGKAAAAASRAPSQPSLRRARAGNAERERRPPPACGEWPQARPRSAGSLVNLHLRQGRGARSSACCALCCALSPPRPRQPGC